MRSSRRFAAVAAVVVVAGLTVVAPAQAAQGRALGAKSCTAGGVATSARATGSQVHQHNSDYKTFAASSAYVTRTFYSGLKNVTYSYVEVSGALSTTRIFCDY